MLHAKNTLFPNILCMTRDFWEGVTELSQLGLGPFLCLPYRLPAGWNASVMAGSPAVILDGELPLRRKAMYQEAVQKD